MASYLKASIMLNCRFSLRCALLVFISLSPFTQVMAQEIRSQELAPIVVKGTSDLSDDMNAKLTQSATKTLTPVVEIPQSVSIVTRKQLDEQDPQTVKEALRYTAGVLETNNYSIRMDQVMIRGFNHTVSYLDGLNFPSGQNYTKFSIDPFFLERIEVLKGPSAVLYGQVTPGGLVNQVSREPSGVQSNELRVEGGNHGRFQTGFASAGPLTSDGVWQYSVAAVGRTAGSFYGQQVRERRVGIAPSLKWAPNANTSLVISGFYQRDPEGGLFHSTYPAFLAPANLRPYLGQGLNIGDPSYDSFSRTEYGVGYRFEHHFNDQVTLRSNFRYSSVDVSMHGIQLRGPIKPDGNIPRQAAYGPGDADGFALDNQAEFKFDIGSTKHTMLAGVDIQRAHNSGKFQVTYGVPDINVIHPVYGREITGPFMTFTDSRQSLLQTGVYLQDQIEYKRLRAVLGVRHDWTSQDTDNLLNNTSSRQTSNVTSYRAGLLYYFDNGIAPYASYSTSFEPQMGLNENDDPLIPVTGRQYEVGVKYQPDTIDALFTLSAFDIRQDHVVKANPATGKNIQRDQIHSRGLEFEARGNITRHLEIIGALSLLDTKVSKSIDTSIIGNRPQETPSYFGSLWANYHFDQAVLAGLSVGGGVRFVGSSYGDDANQEKANGYTLLDAAVRYDFGARFSKLKGLMGTLNVTNLLNKKYYVGCSFNIYCSYGNDRTIIAGLRYKW